ncbi:ferredoxin-type protein NapF [Vibrio sp.]|nr:ferredoxin-type protein NapF [Vibrio sp.]
MLQKKSDIKEKSLPWIKNQSTFHLDCTQCGKCLSHCPEGIITKGDGGYPSVDFNLGECTFCYDCASHCPEPIFEAKNEEPWQRKAVIQETCIALNDVECRTCGEECEPMAIQFTLKVGKVAQPFINEMDCTGCGACYRICPVNAIEINASKKT